MVKRQRLLKLSITLVLILALTVGILFATSEGWGVKGGIDSESVGTVGSAPQPFADMPVVDNTYVTVNAGYLADADALNDAYFKKKLVTGETEADDTYYPVSTAAEFLYVFTRGIGGRPNHTLSDHEFRLVNNFFINDPSFLIDERLILRGNVTVNGNGMNVITSFTTGFLESNSDNSDYGGFLCVMDDGAVLTNLNYYLAPDAHLNVMFKNADIDNALGGFVGKLDNTATISNCNVNIYGSIYAYHLGNSLTQSSYAGGVFAKIGSNNVTISNNVFNVMGATVSATTHNNSNSGAAIASGFAGVNWGGKLSNNIINVTPSTLIGKDLYGYVYGTVDDDHVDIGIYFGRLKGNGSTGNGNTTYYNGNKFINYNDLYDLTASNTPDPWTLPGATGDGNDISAINSDCKIDTWGASYYGDDIRFVVENGEMSVLVNRRSWTSSWGSVDVDPETSGYTQVKSGSTWYSKKLANGIGTNFEFYKGINGTDKNYEPAPFMLKDDYDWNRLASLSTTAYYTENIYPSDGEVQDDIEPDFVDSLMKFGPDSKEGPQLRKYRKNVVIDAAHAKDNIVKLTSKAAAANGLYAHITGNVTDETGIVVPEKNVLDLSNITRRTGSIKRFNTNELKNSTAGFKGISIINKHTTIVNGEEKITPIADSSAVRKHVGGLVDYMAEGVVIDNCIIDNHFDYVKSGITQANMLTIAATKGFLYYGGLFGFSGAKISNSFISTNSNISSDLKRYGGDTGGKIYHNTIYMGGFSAFANKLDIDNSIINTETLLFTSPSHKVIYGGFTARANDTFNIDGSQIGIKVNNIGGGEQEWRADGGELNSNMSGESTAAGVIGEVTSANNPHIYNVRVDLNMNADFRGTVNTKKAYVFGRVSSSNKNDVKYDLKNVAINVNERFSTWGTKTTELVEDDKKAGLLKTPASNFFAVEGGYLAKNVWVYNASMSQDFADKETYPVNVISLLGSKTSGGNGSLYIKGMHNIMLKPDNSRRTLSEAMTKLATANSNEFTNFKFSVNPSTSFYDMRRMDNAVRTYYTQDSIKNYPSLIPDGDDGIVTYTGTNITSFASVEHDVNPLFVKENKNDPNYKRENPVNAGLGWFSGDAVLVGPDGKQKSIAAIGNPLDSVSYKAIVEPVFKMKGEDIVVDAKNNKLVDYYEYSLVVPNNTGSQGVQGENDGKHQISGLLSTYDIRSGGEWNQVAKNVNAGLDMTNASVRIANNIVVPPVNSSGNRNALLSMGYDETHAVNFKVEGTKLFKRTINPNYDASLGAIEGNDEFIITDAGDPTIDVSYIKGAGGQTVGLIGYVATTGVVQNFNIRGAELILADGNSIKPTTEINMGTIAAINKGTIDNIHVTSSSNNNISVTTDNNVNFGLLVGQNNGTINNVSFTPDSKAKISLNITQYNVTPGAKPVVYAAGIVGVNTSILTNAVANLANFTFSLSTPKTIEVVAGGVAKSTLAASIENMFVSVQKSTFDKATYVPNPASPQTTAVILDNYSILYNVDDGTTTGAYSRFAVSAPSTFDVANNAIKTIGTDGALTKATYDGVIFSITGSDAEVADLVFATHPKSDSNYGHMDFSAEIRDAENFAVVGFYNGADRVVSLKNDTILLTNIDKLGVIKAIDVKLVSNYIDTKDDWNDLVGYVNNDKAEFSGFVFVVRNDFVIETTGSTIAQNDTIFKGSIVGDNDKRTITLKNVTYNGAALHYGLIGNLGKEGSIRSLNIKVEGSYTNDSTKKTGAIVVANNEGLIEDVHVQIAAGNNKVQLKAKNAGILAGINKGSIRSCSIDASETHPNNAVVTILGTNVGMIAGQNTSDNNNAEDINNNIGNISGVSIVMGSVKIGDNSSTNAGFIVGINGGIAKMDSVVNTITVDQADSKKSNYNGKSNYFIAKITATSKANINNVWTLLSEPIFTVFDTPEGYKRFDDSLKIFNVMHNYHLNSNGTITASAVPGVVNFTAAHDADNSFYGYVSNFQHAVAEESALSMAVKNMKNKEYAAVFADTNISTYEDLNALRDHLGTKHAEENAGVNINGIVFTVEKNTRIVISGETTLINASGTDSTIRKRVDWTPFDEFNHVLAGSTGSVIALDSKFTAADVFDGIFASITETGGINNITFELTGVTGLANDKVDPNIITPDISSPLVGINRGNIANVDVQYTGRLHATNNVGVGAERGAAGVIAAKNMGTITASNVSLFVSDTANKDENHKDIFTTIEAYNAGALVGLNEGSIVDSTADIGTNVILKGTEVGGLVGHNTATAFIGDDGKGDTVTISGNMLGTNMGGIAGTNDGIINNVRTVVRFWGERPKDMVDSNLNFGGIAGQNTGLISWSTFVNNADSTKSKLNKIAGIAVDSTGTIYNTIVNINAPFVAVDVAAGAVYSSKNVGTATKITWKGTAYDIDNVMYGLRINIDSALKANSAVGLALINGSRVHNIFIYINAPVQGDKYASMLGREVEQYSNGNSVTLVSYDEVKHETQVGGKTVVTYSYELGNNNNVVLDNNSRVVIMGNMCPTITDKSGLVSASYVINESNIKYYDSWLIRENSYHIDKGNLGLNEYKHIAEGSLDIDIQQMKKDGSLIIKSTSGASEHIFLREVDKDGSAIPSIPDQQIAGTNNSFKAIPELTTPAPEYTDRVLIFSQYILDIDSKEDFVTINNNMENNDLFYDVAINLNVDVVVKADMDVTPFGNMNVFNSTFNGGQHTITVERSFTTRNAGLFGTIGKAGIVNDLIVNIGSENYSVRIGSESASVYSGGLAGVIQGKVNNVAVKIYNTGNETSDEGPVADKAVGARIPIIESSKMKGAFAGMIDSKAVVNNAWVFVQSGRYAPANGDGDKLTPSKAYNNNYNIVNLGGLYDVEIAFTPEKVFTVKIDQDALDNKTPKTSQIGVEKVYDWTNEMGVSHNAQSVSYDEQFFDSEVVEHVQVDNQQVDKKFNIYKLASDTFVKKTTYNVSLIRNEINDLKGLIRLSNDQSGFNIPSTEVFNLTADIELTKESLDNSTFFSIGSSKTNRDFDSVFNGNGHTITFGDGVIIKESNTTLVSEDGKETMGDLAGLFGRLGASANVNNLKVVFNTDQFKAKVRAGGLAGDNKSSNISNVIVDIRKMVKPDKDSSMIFGGIFGDSPANLDIKTVYLVKNFVKKSEENGNYELYPVAGTNYNGKFNVITVYKKSNDKESIDFQFAVNNEGKKVIRAVAVGNNFYGVINTTSIDFNGKGVTDIADISNETLNNSQEYAAVFVNTKINSLDSLADMVKDIDDGFNVRHLEYELVSDLVFQGTSVKEYNEITGIGNNTPLKANFNGNGHTVTIRNMTAVGKYAGFFGVIDTIGVVKNLVIDVANSQMGHKKDATHDYATVNAGVIAAVNNGTIENVVVYDKDKNNEKDGRGITYDVSGAYNIMVGVNNGTLNNVWLMQNNRHYVTVADKAVNVINIVGKKFDDKGNAINDIDKITIKNGVILAHMNASNNSANNAFMYDIKAMGNNLNKDDKLTEALATAGVSKGDYNIAFPTEEANATFNSRYFLADFSFVISNEAQYKDVVDRVNNGTTSFDAVEISIDNSVDSLVIGDMSGGVEDEIGAIGTRERPFNGIFNGNGKKIIFHENVKAKGEMYAGVFGNVAATATIKNVELFFNGRIEATPYTDAKDPQHPKYSDIYAGVIAYNRGTINNVVLVATGKVVIDTILPDEGFVSDIVTAGGIAFTEVPVKNVWYLKDTATVLAPSSSKTSAINTFTVVGKAVKNGYFRGTNQAAIHTSIEGNKVVFTLGDKDGNKITAETSDKAFGTLYEDFNNANRKKEVGYKKDAYDKTSQVWEWVNYAQENQKYLLGDDPTMARADFAQLAQDTRGGYTFKGIEFVIKSPISIPASKKYSLGAFAGTITSDVADIVNVNGEAVDVQNVADITITEDETLSIAERKDFALFSSLETDARIEGKSVTMTKPSHTYYDPFYIKIGTDNVPYTARITSSLGRMPAGLFANINNGTINGVDFVANIATDVREVVEQGTGGAPDTTKVVLDKIKDFSAFVGTNNAVISNVNIDVSTHRDVNKLNTTTAIRVDGMYGHIAAVNNNSISNVTVNAHDAKVFAGDNGKYAYGVALNNSQIESVGSMEDITILVGNNSTIKADKSNRNASFVGGIVGINKGTLNTSTIKFVGIPDKDSYFLQGYQAAFFVGKNEGGEINDLVADATISIDTRVDSINQTAGFIKAYTDANAIDINDGKTTNKNITVMISATDKALVDGEINTNIANVIVLTGLGKIAVDKQNAHGYKFSNDIDPEYAKNNGIEFNGWFEYGNNKPVASSLLEGNVFVPAEGSTKGKYEAVYYNTFINDATTWHMMTDLVNNGKDVKNVVFKLTADNLVLENPVPIGTFENPFDGGHFDGQGKSITITSTKPTDIKAEYAGLFGYVKDADIANIKTVQLDKNITYNGVKAAGVLVAYANNSNIGTGVFGKNGRPETEFSMNDDKTSTMMIINNGTIKAIGNIASAAGAVGEMHGGNLKYVTVVNNGTIEATVNGKDVYAGGIIGMNDNGIIGSIVVTNEGVIYGNTAGGAIGYHTSTEVLDGFSVISCDKNSLISGNQAAGFIGAHEAGSFHAGLVKFSNVKSGLNDANAFTPEIKGTDVATDVWVVTNPGTKVLSGSVEALPDTHSIRVLRTADVSDIAYIAKEAGTPNEVFASLIDGDTTYDYWKYTNKTESLYSKDTRPAWFTDLGIKRTTGTNLNIDITLEKKDTVSTIDEMRALYTFAKLNVNKGAINADDYKKDLPQYLVKADGTSTIYLGASLDLSKNVLNLATETDIDLIGRTLNGNGHIINIDDQVFFDNGTLDNMVISIANTASNITIAKKAPVEVTPDGEGAVATIEKSLKLASGVILVDSEVYETNEAYTESKLISTAVASTAVAGKAALDDFTYLDKNGTFNLANVELTSDNKPTIYTRDFAYTNDGLVVNKVFGNVPLYVNNGEIRGYIAENSLFSDYNEDVTNTSAIYYFMNDINADNNLKVFLETNALFNDGYTFQNATINVNIDINMASVNTIGNATYPFEGTIDGHGHTLTFPAEYAPMFAKIGVNGVIKNFVVKVGVKEKTPVFQGSTSATNTGVMQNIIIINTSLVQYPEAAIDYDRVLVVQDKNVVVPENKDYTRLFALNIDKATACNGGTDVDSCIDIAYDSKNETFTITSKIDPSLNVMFGGFIGNIGTENEGPVDTFAKGLGTSTMSKANAGQIFVFATISKIINESDSANKWNAIAGKVNAFNTNTDTIMFNDSDKNDDAFITIGTAITAMGSTKYNSATIDGQNNVIVLDKTFTNVATALFDNYNGTIKNLIIDATATPLGVNDIVKNATKTTFVNVFVVVNSNAVSPTTAGSEAENISKLVTIAIDPTIAVDEQKPLRDKVNGYTYDTSGKPIIKFVLNNTSIIHIEDADGKAIQTKNYGQLDFNLTADEVQNDLSDLYIVTRVSDIYKEQQLMTTNWANNGKLDLSLDNFFVVNVTHDIELTNNNVTIDANGGKISVADAKTLTLNGVTLKNVIIIGNGNTAINGGDIDTAIITTKLTSAGSPTINNVWVNAESKNATPNVYTIDLSTAYDSDNSELFAIKFHPAVVDNLDTADVDETADAYFSITFKNSANRYFIGRFDTDKYVKGNVDDEFTYNLAAYEDVAKFEFVSSVINKIDDYNALVAKINISDFYSANDTYAGSFFVANTLASTNTLAFADLTKKIVLEGYGKSLITIYDLAETTFNNVTLKNVAVEIVGAATLAADKKYAVTIGDNTLIMTYLLNFDATKLTTVAEDTKRMVVRVMNYGNKDNKYVYNTEFATFDIKIQGATAFQPKGYNAETKDEQGNVIPESTYNIKTNYTLNDLVNMTKNVKDADGRNQVVSVYDMDVIFVIPVTVKGNLTEKQFDKFFVSRDGRDAKRVIYKGQTANSEVNIPVTLRNFVVNTIKIGNKVQDLKDTLINTNGDVDIKTLFNDKGIDLYLDVDMFAENNIKNITEEYSFIFDVTKYDVTSISDRLNNFYELPQEYKFRLKEGDELEAIVKGNKQPDVKRDATGAVVGYERVIEIFRTIKAQAGSTDPDTTQVVGELHYTHTINPYNITGEDIRLKDEEYIDNGKFTPEVDTSLKTTVVENGNEVEKNTFLGELKAFDEAQYNALLDELNKLSFNYKNITVVSVGAKTALINGEGFNTGNFMFKKDTAIPGNIVKRNITVHIEDMTNDYFNELLKERTFNHKESGDSIFNTFTYDQLMLNSTARVEVKDSGDRVYVKDVPLAVMIDGVMSYNVPVIVEGIDGKIGTADDETITVDMTPYKPAKVGYRNESAKSFIYVEDYANRILDVKTGGHRLVSNIADSNTHAFDLNVVDKAKGNYIIQYNAVSNDVITKNERKLNVLPNQYSVFMEDLPADENNWGYAKTFLSKVNKVGQFKTTVKDVNGNVVDGLFADMEYVMWDAVSKVVGGTRVYTLKPGEYADIIGAYDKIVLSTNTIARIPSANYEIIGTEGSVVDAKKNTITSGKFTTENTHVVLSVDPKGESVTFNGKDRLPNIKLNLARTYDTSGIITGVNVIESIDEKTKEKTPATNAVASGLYGVAIRVYTNILEDANGKPLDITQYIINNFEPSKGEEDVELINKEYFYDTFHVTPYKAGASMNNVFKQKPIEVTYGDDVLESSAFIKFVNADVDKLIGTEGFELKVVVKDAEGKVVDYTNKLPVGNYTVEYDTNGNAQLEENFDVVISGSTVSNLRVNKKKVNVTMTLVGGNEIVYGTAFAGHTPSYSVKAYERDDNGAIVRDKDGKPVYAVEKDENGKPKKDKDGNIIYKYIDWVDFINTEKFAIKYSDEKLVVGETVFDAGKQAFGKDSVVITPDDNHIVDVVFVEALTINPKQVVISMKDGLSITKFYGQQVESMKAELDEGLLIDGQPANNVISGTYSFDDKIGTQHIILTGITSNNYVMSNEAVDLGAILTVNKTPYTPSIDKIVINEVNNTTTITLKSKVGEMTSKATFKADGVLTKPEEIETAITNFLRTKKGVTDDLYILKPIKNLDKEAIVEDEFKPIMPLIIYAILGVCALAVIILLISSIVSIHTMPSGFNKDFNFSRDPGKKDTANLMKAVGKRRAHEYKSASKRIEKAAKKGKYYNIENDIFPEDTGSDNEHTEE